jgi:hypothetical protein
VTTIFHPSICGATAPSGPCLPQKRPQSVLFSAGLHRPRIPDKIENKKKNCGPPCNRNTTYILCVWVCAKWRKLHNEELNDLYPLPNIVRVVKSRRLRLAGHVARMGGERVHTVLVGKPEGMRPLERPRRRWEDNIKMDLQEVGGVVGTGWMERAQDRDSWREIVGTVMNFRVP